MSRGQRPAGRQKNVESGTGDVRRRGGGLFGRRGQPVGDASGYSDRQTDLPTGGSEAPPRTTASRSPGGGGFGTGIALVGIVLFLLYSAFSGGLGDLFGSGGQTASGYQPPTATSVPTYVDQGAYSANTAVAQPARAKRTTLKGNGADTATIMVYMCATDLESQSGMATADLNEMLYAQISDKVNIIVETGGTTKWQNNVISSRTNQRYRVTSKGLEVLAQDLGRKSMVQPATLSDFIKFGKAEYPADRYWLVLWDHGGGSLTGYGYDQNFPGDSMTIDEVGTALKDGGCAFEVVGFDACLMATLEAAVVLEPYADYMIASEEVEPGVGWDYTGWITSFSGNTSASVVTLGKKLIDDYVTEAKAKAPGSQATLSLLDLAELKGTVPAAFAAFASATTKLIDEDQYKTVADARAGTKEFGASSRINQIDLIHFAENLGTDKADALAAALRSCVKYNRTSTNVTNANGVSVWFPYGRLTQVSSMLETYDEIGFSDEYSACIRSFASVSAGGQVASPGSGNLFEILFGTTPAAPRSGTVGAMLDEFIAGGDFSRITGSATDKAPWLDTDKMRSAVAYYQGNRLDASALKITEKGGQRVLTLSEPQWDLIQYMEMNVFVDDGEGYIDLGLDNVYEYNEDGDLVMEYDGTWLALNGLVVSYYLVSDDQHGDQYSIRGRVPALLNDQPVDIILEFTNLNPGGAVLGAQVKYDPVTQTETVAKGLLAIAAGDKIDFLCDHYDYDGVYSDSYYLGEQYVATGQWRISNISIGTAGYLMTYRITDIYGNQYWTPAVTK